MIAAVAISSVSSTPLAMSGQLAAMTSGCRRMAGSLATSALVGGLERERLGLEPLPQLVLAAAAGRYARRVVVVQEVVDPVDPLLVAQTHDDTTRLARQGRQDGEVRVVRRSQRQRGEVVEDRVRLAREHRLDRRRGQVDAREVVVRIAAGGDKVAGCAG